jgi:seipin
MAARIKATEAYEDDDYSESEERGIISTAVHLALRPIQPFISRPALKAYLTTIFAVCTAFTLFGVAIVAYVLFHQLYMPRIGFSRDLYLQYDHILIHQQSPRDGSSSSSSSSSLTPHPWATATLTPDMASGQAYDVTVELTLPYTLNNREAGNFMLDMQLLAPSSTLTPMTSTTVLAQNRVPALLPYRSRLVHLAQTLLSLPYYTFGLRTETSTLSIPAFSRVEFPKGWRSTPSTLRLEVQSIRILQIEKAQVHFRARFRGLRWIMYNHRIISTVVFVSMFWVVECVFAGLAWVFLSFHFAAPAEASREPKAELPKDGQKAIKSEEAVAMSDTERTFPSRTGQGIVRYSSPDVKKEEEVQEADLLSVPEHVARAAEADVEDEGEDSNDGLDSFRDSGIWTSLDS